MASAEKEVKSFSGNFEFGALPARERWRIGSQTGANDVDEAHRTEISRNTSNRFSSLNTEIS
ncbi:hypothetical protein [Roseibium marinum]|uniref:hypothetical protein n=1 Tax=Roseibium marinum TaxID=281252 RepID=UPI0011AF5C5D|nr:hypothetical protein [Roseibium marinum]